MSRTMTMLAAALLPPAPLVAEDAAEYDTYEAWATIRIPRTPGVEIKEHDAPGIRYFFVEGERMEPRLLILSAQEPGTPAEGTPVRGVIAGRELEGTHVEISNHLSGDVYTFPCGAEGAKCRVVIYDGPCKAQMADLAARMQATPGPEPTEEDKAKALELFDKLSAANRTLAESLSKVTDEASARDMLPRVQADAKALRLADRVFQEHRTIRPYSEKMILTRYLTSGCDLPHRTESVEARRACREQANRLMQAGAFGVDELRRVLIAL